MALIPNAGDYSNRELEWTLATGDTATPAEPPSSGPLGAAVQLSGTWGGATVKLQGSNDGATWFDLSSPAGDAITATADAMFELSTGCRFIKPILTGGAGSSVACIIFMRG